MNDLWWEMYNLITYGSKNSYTKYDFLNRIQVEEIVNGYVSVDCQRLCELVFGEGEMTPHNPELISEAIVKLETGQVFDGELYGPDDETIIGAITIERVR